MRADDGSLGLMAKDTPTVWIVDPTDPVTAPVQQAALACFTPEALAIYEERRREFQRRRDFLVPALRGLGFGVPVMPDGAFYAFPRITSTGLDSDTFTERLLREERVAVVPGNAFGPSGEGHVRMCYATAYDQLEEAVRRITRFVERVRAEP